uniref:TLC domain-containing protein n=1 Tax=Heterorhabditis bacteriophora TaxID=37862 RepID=A0A1I7XEP9_HETBA
MFTDWTKAQWQDFGLGCLWIFLSSGYLLHDLIDLLVNEQSARIMELLFHHVIVLLGFAVTLNEESPHEVAVQTIEPSERRVLVDDNTQTVA